MMPSIIVSSQDYGSESIPTNGAEDVSDRIDGSESMNASEAEDGGDRIYWPESIQVNRAKGHRRSIILPQVKRALHVWRTISHRCTFSDALVSCSTLCLDEKPCQLAYL